MPTSSGSWKKQESFRKNIYLCFIDYAKAFDCVVHSTLWKTLQEMGITDHLTCLLRNLYAGQEATVRIGHGTTVQFSRSVMSNYLRSHELACQPSLSITNSRSSVKLMSIELVMPSNHLILCHLLILLPSIFPSIRVFSNESVLHIRWPKYWSFSFSINPSKEYSGLISFRIDGLISLLSKGL